MSESNVSRSCALELPLKRAYMVTRCYYPSAYLERQA
ncbi:hypothetical protein C8J41_103259 [Sphingomonas sp. PP-CC-3G-468]|nr:hypothetical protein C8J41_103259 [Sphingomonas sp. PP-CC-3G-468]